MEFCTLSESSRAEVREAQKKRKEQRRVAKEVAKKKAAKKKANKSMCAVDSTAVATTMKRASLVPSSTDDQEEYRTFISMDDYFGACPGGIFRHPLLPPLLRSLEILLLLLNNEDKDAQQLQKCQYFQFSPEGEDEAGLWDPTLNAALAYRGFFVVTAHTGPQRRLQPLPELQPFNSVLRWGDFHRCKHVRKTLNRLRRSQVPMQSSSSSSPSPSPLIPLSSATATLKTPHSNSSTSISSNARRYSLVCGADPERTWQKLENYHSGKNDFNWLTKSYFEMMKAGSADPSLNFEMNCVEMFAETPGSGKEPELVAGEIGFTVGRVYTSLSGWIAARTNENTGTTQLVLLCLWLEHKGYAFWSLGHCYSPELDYKRKLGAVIYPRKAFLKLLEMHRGSFVREKAAATPKSASAEASPKSAVSFAPLVDGESCTAFELLQGGVGEQKC